MKIRKNSGFTLVEVLAAVAILAVLLAFAAVSTLNYIDMLKLAELDNAAKEIYMAAENRSVLLFSTQETDTIFKDMETLSLDTSDPIISLLADEAGDTAYEAGYVTKNEIKSGEVLLAGGSIDPALWDGEGDFIIVYNKANGSVTEVFYVEKPLPGGVGINEIRSFAEPSRAERKKDIDGQKILVGYYSGEGAEGRDEKPAPPSDTPAVTVTIDNGIQLKATVEVKLDGVVDNAVAAKVKEAVVGGLSVELRRADGTLVRTLEPKGAWSGDTYTWGWTLDALEGIDPGENFVVTATLTSYDGSFGTAYDSAEDNSLFAKGSGGGVALIRNLRHLQNLNAATWESFSARQLEDVDGAADIDGDGEKDSFTPIDNKNLLRYDGLGNKIENLNVASADGPAGLFSAFSGESLQNIRLVNTTVTGSTVGALAGTVSDGVTISGCRVYWDDLETLKTYLETSAYPLTGQTAGGLVGQAAGEVTIENSLAATLVDGTSAAGGLVGRAESGAVLTVTNSYADCYLTGDGEVAGLVGELAGASTTAALTDCYAAGFIMDAGAGGGRERAAGLCMGGGTTATESVYSVMVRLDGDDHKTPAYPLTERAAETSGGGTDDSFTDTFFLGSGTVYGKGGTFAQGKSYGAMTDPTGAVFEALAGFTEKKGSASNPYNLLWKTEDGESEKLDDYDYPGLASLPHYGDWGKVDDVAIPVGLAYYELYDSGAYGVFGFDGEGKQIDFDMKTDGDGKTIAGYGYAVVFSAEDVEGYDAVTIRINNSTVKSEKTIWKPIKPDDGREYYIVTDFGDLQPGNTVVANFYTYLKIGMMPGAEKELEGEYEYYFNPHFAKTVVSLAEETLPEGSESWSDAIGAYANKMLIAQDVDVAGETERKAEREIIIRTPGQLNNLNVASQGSKVKYYTSSYAFHQELDLVLTSGENANYDQTPLGIAGKHFSAIYDGGGHTISGLNISGGDVVGLFGYVNYGAVIKNLTVDGAVTGGERIGGIVGELRSGTVKNCRYTGTVSGTGKYVGGVVGRIDDGDDPHVVESCYNTGAVFGGGNNVGGVAGSIAKGTVKNCYNTGAVSGGDNVGGVAGYISANGGIKNCYNIGEVSGGGNYVGGVLGYRATGGEAINCCYLNYTPVNTADSSKSNRGNGYRPDLSDNWKALSRADFADFDLTAWNEDGEVWTMASDTPYINGYRPVLKEIPESYEGTEDAPYIINNRLDLENVASIVSDRKTNPGNDKYFKLTADIELHGESNPWRPIGIYTPTRFNANFDGGGHRLTGLYINAEADSYQGLFGYNTGTIQNLNVEDGNVTGISNVGGIAGANDGTVENCVYSGKVTGTLNGKDAKTGGIVGSNTGTVEKCVNKATVKASNIPVSQPAYVGGVAGSSGGSVTDCENEGQVSTTGYGAGGVVGANTGTVTNCGNNAAVGGSLYVGGVVGFNSDGGQIDSCHNTGSVTGTAPSTGGVVGENRHEASVVKNCDNAGTVTGDQSSVGGIAGSNSGSVEKCVNTAEIISQKITPGNPAYVGGVVGTNNGSVTDCENEGTLNVSGYGVGGVVGNSSKGTVTRCKNKGEVHGSHYTGGVVGYNSAAVEICYNTGDVYGTANSVGGVVGLSKDDCAVSDCYNTGDVTGSSNVGGVVGYVYNDISEVKNCYNIGGVTGKSYVGGVVGRNAEGTVTYCYYLKDEESAIGGINGQDVENRAEAKSVYEFNTANESGEEGEAKGNFGWDFADTWEMSGALGRPILQKNREGGEGTALVPYEISTAEGLAWFRDQVNSGKTVYGILTEDIDLKDEPWEPIGNNANNSAYHFKGVFDGGGHTIRGLNVSSDGSGGNLGLFGRIGTGGVVQNLNVEGKVSAPNGNNIGGIAGSSTGTVKNCGFSGAVEGNSFAGGIVGRCFSGEVSDCWNEGSVKAGNGNAGGIVGYSGVSVSGCYNSGSVSGTTGYFGGVVGCNTDSGNVADSYNTGSVTCDDSGRVGGIAGYNSGEVTNCYNVGTISGGTYIGGVVGTTTSSDKVSGCYYLDTCVVPTNRYGTAKPAGDFAGAETGFDGWDFDTTWEMGTFIVTSESGLPGQRPVLRNNNEPKHRDESPFAAAGGRVVTASVGGGIPGSGTWTVSVDSADGSAGASFARDGELSAVDDGGGGTVPLYLTGPDGDGAPAVVSVTYTYTAGDAAEGPEEVPAEAGPEAPDPAWALAALPPEPQDALPELKDPDDAGPEE